MIVSFLLSFALASEPPERPTRPGRYPFECPQAFGVTVDQRTPLVDSQGVATCSGVMTPTSEAYYLQAVKNWADESVAFYEAQAARDAVTIARAEAAARQARRAAWIASAITASAFGGVWAASRLDFGGS